MSPAEMRRRYERLESLRTIGRAAGVTRDTVKRRLVAQGVKIRPKGGGRAKLNLHRVADLYHDLELPQHVIGRRLGVSQQAIHYALKRIGLACRSHGGSTPATLRGQAKRNHEARLQRLAGRS